MPVAVFVEAADAVVGQVAVDSGVVVEADPVKATQAAHGGDPQVALAVLEHVFDAVVDKALGAGEEGAPRPRPQITDALAAVFAVQCASPKPQRVLARDNEGGDAVVRLGIGLGEKGGEARAVVAVDARPLLWKPVADYQVALAVAHQ